MKRILLALAAIPLFASPAFAGCYEDFMTQTKAIPPLQTARLRALMGPQDEKCKAHRAQIDAYAKLSDLYQRCQKDLQFPDNVVQEQKDLVADEEKSYAEECKG